MIVGFTGPAGSGKSTAAGYLDTGLGGYQLETLASGLKVAAGKLFGLSGEQLYGKLKEVPDEMGFTPRSRLQLLGDHCKDLYGNDFFVDSLLARVSARMPGVNVVIDDVRFLGEAEAIRKAGGIIIGVKRPLIFDSVVKDAANGDVHRSEAEMVENWHDMCDYEVNNDVEGVFKAVLRGANEDAINLHGQLQQMMPLLKWLAHQYENKILGRPVEPVPEDVARLEQRFTTRPKIFLGAK